MIQSEYSIQTVTKPKNVLFSFHFGKKLMLHIRQWPKHTDRSSEHLCSQLCMPCIQCTQYSGGNSCNNNNYTSDQCLHIYEPVSIITETDNKLVSSQMRQRIPSLSVAVCYTAHKYEKYLIILSYDFNLYKY